MLRQSVRRVWLTRNHCNRLIISLSVIIEKEERLVLHDRAAQVAAELVEMIVAIGQPRPVVFPAIGIQRLVAEKLKRGSMPVVRAALRNHVDHSATRAAHFRRVTIGGDLEFLYGVLAEAVRTASRAGAPGGLSEEHVVRVRAIHGEAVGGAPLAAEAQIAAARWIAHHPGSQYGEIQEVTAIDRQIRDRSLSDNRRRLGTRRLDHWRIP